MEKITVKFSDYLLLAAAFIVGVVFGIFILLTTAPQEEVDYGTTKSDVSIEKADLSRDVSVYLAWWDQDNGFESIQENASYISTVNPFWYEMKEDGSVEPFSGAEDQEVINFCRENGISIIPVISNEHERYPVDAVFSDASLTEFHIEEIVSLVLEKGYDGIEIDYESLDAEDRQAYSDFMSDLSAALHAEGKVFSTAVHAKTSDAGTWGGPAAQDWYVLNSVCDSIKIMTYDYHWSSSDAGDIAPISWMRDVLDYAVTVVSPEKIQLGIHLYGYDWEGTSAADLTYSDVQDLIDRYAISEISVSDEMEKFFTYEKDNAEHAVYFSDNSVVSPRVELAEEYELGGIAMWRVGQEDSAIWTDIAASFAD